MTKENISKLKLLAEDVQDLNVFSAYLQDSVIVANDIKFLPKTKLIFSSRSGLIGEVSIDPTRSPIFPRSGAISLHAAAIEMVSFAGDLVSSAGGAESDESDSEPLQLVRAIATKANATVAL